MDVPVIDLHALDLGSPLSPLNSRIFASGAFSSSARRSRLKLSSDPGGLATTDAGGDVNGDDADVENESRNLGTLFDLVADHPEEGLRNRFCSTDGRV